MTNTTVSTANEAKQWDSKYFTEYVRKNRYSKEMGMTEFDVIQINEKLGKRKGDAVTVSLIGRSTAASVGAGTLEGNEEALGNFGHQINLGVVRKAIAVDEFEEQSTEIDLRNAARAVLNNWSMDNIASDIDEALFQVNGVNYGTATAGAHDTWASDNDDRIHYVGLAAPTGNHTTDLAGLAAGTDIMSGSVVDLCRRKAMNADPHIRPFRVNGFEEWMIFYMDSYMHRDLKADTAVAAANRDAWTRGKDNPVFRPGDILYNGVICRDMPSFSSKIDTASTGVWGAGATADGLHTAGTSSARVGVGFMCGAQAVGLAWGQRTKSTTRTAEYGFLHGVGIQEFRGIEKLLYQTRSGKTNACDHGVFTVFAAAALD